MESKNPLDLLLRPQDSFKVRPRDNKGTNAADFCTPEQFLEIETKINSLTENDMLCDDKVTFKPYQHNSYILIDTEENLRDVIENDIKLARSLGVDVEQTNKSSYQGYICLIQISTEKYDYIIDTIALHDVIKRYLYSIFADPMICKIFYAGRSDIKWLNRDFGIFIVNYFDLQFAFGTLQLKGENSLVTLLNKYCDLGIEKQDKKNLQVSDWRVRPLAKDQLNYAAIDSHFLRYLRSKLIAELSIKFKDNTEKLKSFFSKMQKECLTQYRLKEFQAIKLSKFFSKESELIFAGKGFLEEKAFSILQKGELLDSYLNILELVDNFAREIDVSPPEICDKREVLVALVELTELTRQNAEFTGHIKYFCEKVNGQPLFELFFNAFGESISNVLVGKERKSYDIKQMILNKSKVSDKKLERKKKYTSLQSNTQKGYENCVLLKPNGDILSYCDREKINYYLSKGLATLVPDTQFLTIKLNFEPAQSRDATDAYISDMFSKVARVNHCMICGQTNSYTKIPVIPDRYRAFLPENFK